MGAFGSPELHPVLRDNEYDQLKQIKWKYCEKCGHQFLERYLACPKCGYKPKRIRSGWTVFWAVIALLEAMLIGYSVYLTFFANSQVTDNNSAFNQFFHYTQNQMLQESVYDYKTSCKTIDYATLARNPDKYEGERFIISGEVIQVVEIDDGVLVRMDITYIENILFEGGYWIDTIIATIPLSKGSDRILEGNVITVWGECKGVYTYETVFGNSLSVPYIGAQYYELND